MHRLLALLPRYLAFWVLLGAAAAYIWPGAFAWLRWPLRHLLLGGFLEGTAPLAAASPYDLPGQALFQWLFAATMLAVGTVLEPRSFLFVARRPLAVALGLLTQFTVMPSLAWLAGWLGGFDDAIVLGFLIVGCAPGAMTSNVLTYLAGGDTAYSVSLTALASIAAVALTPGLVWLLAGEELGMSAAKFRAQLWTIAWSLAAPLAAGIALRALTPRLRRTYERLGPAAAALAIIAICCSVIEWTRAELAAATPAIFAAVVAVNALGLLAGGLLGRLYGFDRPRRVTLAIEVGMQNAGLGVVLAASTFSDRPAVAIPAALFTIWCIASAAALAAVLRRRGEPPGAYRKPSQ
jgi:BASS family bile acid:Na+ symporter